MSGMKKIICKCHKFFVKSSKEIYNIDGFDIDLGEGHMLSVLQKEHTMYDRFVPFLGTLSEKSGGENKYFIDIGANVGDTVAGFIRHTSAKVICVEPTKKFYDLCKKNITGFGKEYETRITLVQGYISSRDDEKFSSVVQDGTAIKKYTEGHAEAPTYTIPTLCKVNNIPLEDIVLVKTDTDGYDFDCITSFGDHLKDISPILYWENQIDNLEQFNKFLDMANYLSNCGYNDYFVFDNFGNYLCHVDVDGLKDINCYLARIYRGASTRSFYYVDILAAKNEHVQLCKETVAEYLSLYE